MDSKTTPEIIISTISQVEKNYSQFVKTRFNAVKLKGVYCKLLSALAEQDGGTQLDLVNKTGIKAPTVSITLREMEKLGYVTRHTDDSDLRKTHVFLTDKGRQANEIGEKTIADANCAVVNNISDEDLQSFIRVLNVINSNVKK